MLAVASCVAAAPIGATKLWRAVVARALLDSLAVDMGSDQHGAKAVAIGQACAWLARPSDPDVGAVLDLAGFEPDALRRALPRLQALWQAADAGTLDLKALGKRRTRGFRRGTGRARKC